MIRVDHAALWTCDLERLRAFYERYFEAVASARYENPRKQFQSYFLSFSGGARIELMHSPRVETEDAARVRLGYAHLAIGLGSEPAVDALTATRSSTGRDVQGTATTRAWCWTRMATGSS